MSFVDSVIKGYEDTLLLDYRHLDENFGNTVYYDQLSDHPVDGVLKINRYDENGRLMQTYSDKENHVGVIAATRLGKTTSYVIPTILSFAKNKQKRSMVISDPKGELYKLTAETMKREGYRVRLLNFRDYMHSECWNPLTPIFRRYIEALGMDKKVTVVDTPDGPRNYFNGRIYEDQALLDKDIAKYKKILIEDVSNEIDHFCAATIPTINTKDPYWEDSARDLLKAGIWAMLEDVKPVSRKTPKITEETFSISTLLSVYNNFYDDSSSFDDNGYFTDRPRTSNAFILANMSILQNGNVTRKCIISVFNAKINVYRNSAIKLITSCNSFEMTDLSDDVPTIIYINYHDEKKTHYQVISTFIQSAYNYLIGVANDRDSGMLDKPFYFILDEFGNFPAIPDFETVISACGGRNIFFILILQSYAQLENVYGKATADIIKDNLNMHVFIGSNNPETLNAFSAECGEWARLSPTSALNGNGDGISAYQIETIRRMPKSNLARLKEGECIVTEANCGYVLFSKLERYYKCKEFSALPLTFEKDYFADIDPLDDKYIYDYYRK